MASRTRAAARYHGDQAAGPGMLDFAVNVRTAEPPSWLVERLASRLADLGRYPSTVDERRATDAVAARHGRDRDEVALLAGAAEGFALLANLRPTLAALIAPSFTEPEAALSAAGVALQHVVLAPPYGLADADVPEDADLVVVGNPTNPTGGTSFPRPDSGVAQAGSHRGRRRSVRRRRTRRAREPGRPRAARRGGAAQPDQDVGAWPACGSATRWAPARCWIG